MTIGIPRRSPIQVTNQSRRCLTSEIGRDRVHSTWYGRRAVLVNIYTPNLFKNLQT